MTKYSLRDIVDLSKLQNLMDKFYNLTGISHYIVSKDGEILAKTDMQYVCKKFHIDDSRYEGKCYDEKVKNGKVVHIEKNITIYKCINGFMKASIPIDLEGEYMGRFVMAQFFIKEPDLDYFKKQARLLKVDEEEYIDAIKKVPVVKKEKIKDVIGYYENLGYIIGELGIDKNHAEEYERMRTEFFANISHEFRTPLNMIFTSLQMCELVAKNIRNNTHDELKNINKYTRIIRQNSYRLIKMVDNLIDLNKIDAGYFRLYLSNINIVSLVEDITLSVVEYAKNKNIDLLFDTNTEELLVACDGDKIEKIILNLLSNSIKFTPPGGEVLVNIEEMEKNLLITVEDNGIGIPSDKQKLIFDRFIQVDKSLSRNNEGSGIGLSLIKSLVEMHKGKIWVESESGKGSKFFVQIPKRILKEKSFCNNNILENGSKEKTIEIEFSDVYFS